MRAHSFPARFNGWWVTLSSAATVTRALILRRVVSRQTGGVGWKPTRSGMPTPTIRLKKPGRLVRIGQPNLIELLAALSREFCGSECLAMIRSRADPATGARINNCFRSRKALAIVLKIVSPNSPLKSVHHRSSKCSPVERGISSKRHLWLRKHRHPGGDLSYPWIGEKNCARLI